MRIIYLIARNTVDEIVWEQIQRKHQVVGATVGKKIALMISLLLPDAHIQTRFFLFYSVCI